MFVFYYLSFVVMGAILAYCYGKNTKNFLWQKYWALLAAPILGVAGLTFYFGFTPIKMFFLGTVILPMLEWVTGFTYHKVMGVPLWEYSRYPIYGRYSSWLTLPIWGAGMVLLWLIIRNL